MKKYIGIDIGGTKAAAGIVTGAGKLLKENIFFFKDNNDHAGVLKTIEEAINSLMHKEILGLGVGIPAVPDGKPGKNTSIFSNNQHFLEYIDLAKYLERKYSLPVIIDNDANCFIKGEHKAGAAKGYRDCVGITLGTGLGCGIVLNNNIRKGKTLQCGEIYRLKIKDRILDNFVSGNIIAKYSGTKNAKEACELAIKGNKRAIRAFNEYGRWAGLVINAIQLLLDPEIFVLGGSVSNAHKLFFGELKKAAGKTAPVVISKLKHKAAIIGAVTEYLQ